jgi:nicotinamidase-related amidase
MRQYRLLNAYDPYCEKFMEMKMINTALLVIDVQKGLFEKKIPIYKSEEMLVNICQLATQAHQVGVPVIYVQHTNSTMPQDTEGWKLHPRLQPLDSDYVLLKQRGSAFDNTLLNDRLNLLGVRKLIVTGLVTHGCVKATCLDAVKLGYAVTLVSDANSNFHRKPIDILEETYKQLTKTGIALLPTKDIHF